MSFISLLLFEHLGKEEGNGGTQQDGQCVDWTVVKPRHCNNHQRQGGGEDEREKVCTQTCKLSNYWNPTDCMCARYVITLDGATA